MTLTIDHIVIHVQELQAAMEIYRQAGFTVNYGGQHADGITENGLIVFADGSYIELIALVEGKTYDEALFKQLLRESGEGYTGYALQSDDLEGDTAKMQDRGMIIGDVREGSRARPDGEMLQWKMCSVRDAMNPFLIQDVTDRDLRVPLTPENTNHANGARGIHEVLIYVNDIDAAIEQYGDMVGSPLVLKGSARFEVGASAIVVATAHDGQGIPYQLSIKSDEPTPKLLELTGARFLLL